MLHLKNSSKLNRKMAKNILRESRRLASGMDLILRDCRISKKYVELDTSIPQSNLDELIEKLSPIGPLDHAKHVVEEIIEKEEAISEGISYFNNERFWECHEAFEGAWKQSKGDEKELIQGLILIAAALVHYQKDEDDICLSVLGRALEKLRDKSGQYCEINVDSVKQKTIEMLDKKEIFTFMF